MLQCIDTLCKLSTVYFTSDHEGDDDDEDDDDERKERKEQKYNVK